MEHGLILTIMVGFKQDVPIPCAFYLSERRTDESYQLFYNVSYAILCCFPLSLPPSRSPTHKHQTLDTRTYHKFRPAGCAMDFEVALATALRKVFGGDVSIFRDYFHLQVSKRCNWVFFCTINTSPSARHCKPTGEAEPFGAPRADQQGGERPVLCRIRGGIPGLARSDLRRLAEERTSLCCLLPTSVDEKHPRVGLLRTSQGCTIRYHPPLFFFVL